MLAVPLEVPSRSRKSLERRGLATVGDLLETPPRTYRDYGAQTTSVLLLSPGDVATVRGVVESIRERSTSRRNLRIVTAQIVDESGGLTAVWFNQRHLARLLAPGSLVQVHGEIREGRGGSLEMAVKEYELLADADGEGGALHTVGIVPVYDATSTLPSRLLHGIVAEHLHRLDATPEPLPAALRVARKLPLRRDALAALHAPRERGRAARRAQAARLRGAAAAAARAAPPSPRARPRGARAAAAGAGRARPPLPRRPALLAHRAGSDG